MANTATGMPTPTNPAPDVAYFQSTGFALLAATLIAGAISVVGTLNTSKPLEMAQSAESASPIDDSLLQLMERSISEREILQAHNINSRSI